MSELDLAAEERAETGMFIAPAAEAETSSFLVTSILSWSKLRQFGSSLIDQGLAVGGMFVANVALARAQSKDEYGMFALTYSIYVFLAAIHNAAILEPYTVHGSGRYHHTFPSYSHLVWRANAMFGGTLTLLLLASWALLQLLNKSWGSKSLLGLALTVSVLLTALLVRRTLYLQRLPELAARFSGIGFIVLVALLLAATRLHFLSGFSIFLIVACSWLTAGAFLRDYLPTRSPEESHEISLSQYWWEHWRYSKWVLATALVFQITNQGYYWILAAFLSVKEVAELRAMYILVGPVDQVFVASSLLVLPAMTVRYVTKRHTELVRLWITFGCLIIGLTLSYALIIWLFAKPLLHKVYSGKFDDMVTVLCVLALLPVMMAIGNGANLALKSMEKPDGVLKGYVVSGATTFVIGIPLVTHFGLRGAVYGMLVSALSYSITMVGSLWVASSAGLERNLAGRVHA